MTLLTILFFLVIYHFLPSIYNVLLSILFICYIGAYIQGNYLITNLPILDGETIQWNKYPLDRFLSILVWFVVCYSVFIIIKKLGYSSLYKYIKYTSIFISLILGITSLSLCIGKKGLGRKSTICVTDKNLSTYSTDTNFIIFTLDSVDAKDLKELLESDKYDNNEHTKNLFEDFTFYYNMMGGYPFTGNSVAFLLSGEWYENQIPSNEYFHNSFTNSLLFNTLIEDSYELGFYFDGLPNLNSDYYKFINIMDSQKQHLFSFDFINMINRLTALKYLPYELKPLVTENMNKFNTSSYLQLMTPIEENCEIYSSNNLAFYSYIKNTDIMYTTNKTFKYIHADGAHAPFEYNKKVQKISDATYETSLEASLTIIETYLEKLKLADVYDNSIIIIVADHGYDSSSDTIQNSYFYRQNPIFFVKGINEKHPYSTSSAPVSFEDLNNAYFKLLNGMNGSHIFDWKEGDFRERRWLYYGGGNETIIEYIQPAEAWNRESIYASGNQYEYKH